jgi:threonine 3-dehydrogenase
VFITGGLGQVGTDLTSAMRAKYGNDNVIVTDLHDPPAGYKMEGPFEKLDCLDKKRFNELLVKYKPSQLVHLSAIMSVLGENKPHLCMDLNIDGLRIALEAAREHNMKIFAPSTMAVFCPESGKTMTKDDCILKPTTLYGITKVLLEQLGDYYFRKFGVDFRCIRYPGVISAPTLPGGGTTDYAIHMYHSALKKKPFTCPVLPNEPLPMVYVDDAINGTVQLMEAPRASLKRSVYNMAAFSFTPDELARNLAANGYPLSVEYKEGIQQKIAHSWPDTIDDTNARQDWGWNPQYDLDRTTKLMLKMIPTIFDLSK